MNVKELQFVIFSLENLAEHMHLCGDEVYILVTEKSDILDNYIIPCYDALHTQGKEYIVNELIELMQERGIEV